jgi:hypothetical protein
VPGGGQLVGSGQLSAGGQPASGCQPAGGGQLSAGGQLAINSRPSRGDLLGSSLPSGETASWAVLDLSSPGVTVETLSTPEMTGLRTISWPRSPTRSFLRNFP